MKTKLLLLFALAVLLAGCGGAVNSTLEVLPTIVLDAGEPSTENAQPIQNQGDVVASGYVIPAQEAQLSSAVGGAIDQITGSVGTDVKSGQTIVSLNGKEQQLAAVKAAELELLSSQQTLDTLIEEADQARAQAQLRLAEASDAFNEAEKRRGWKEYRIGDDNQVKVAQADLIVAQDWLKRKQDTYGGWADSPEDNLNKAAALSELSNAQKAVDKAQANLNYLMNKPDEYEVAIADANLEMARTELESAQTAFDQMANGPDPDELALAKARVANAQAQLAAAQTTLDNLELKAPFAGTISKLFFQVGEWVQPGQAVLILADLNTLQVETTDLSERDISAVFIGQKASVYIEALNLHVDGTVTEIDPLADTLGGDVVYRSVVVLDEIPERLRAGMSAEVSFLN
ncbi:MAG: efflux RND transporter periplasmic adaptor subunit [Anaerolineaceae bacterium]|nr:efflux RND transporter periplasmic adaptor subunit [Anaerolineaceae bacterium]